MDNDLISTLRMAHLERRSTPPLRDAGARRTTEFDGALDRACLRSRQRRAAIALPLDRAPRRRQCGVLFGHIGGWTSRRLVGPARAHPAREVTPAGRQQCPEAWNGRGGGRSLVDHGRQHRVRRDPERRHRRCRPAAALVGAGEHHQIGGSRDDHDNHPRSAPDLSPDERSGEHPHHANDCDPPRWPSVVDGATFKFAQPDASRKTMTTAVPERAQPLSGEHERRWAARPSRGDARREPRGHWWLTGLLLFVVILALLVHGFIRRQVGATGTQSRDDSPVAGLVTSGAVLDLASGTPRSNATPDGVVALTFDDGPDPRWTPQILDVLARHHVAGTFFVVGSSVLDHPNLVRDILVGGNEIGVHTLTHADVTHLVAWQRNLQLSMTQTAVAGVVGIRPALFRPPYSSTSENVTVDQLAAYRAIARRGYLIALSNFDSEDWRRSGVATIVANARPPDGAGGVVLFHDGGGDRSQTVEALDQYITALKANGYRFVTVSELAGLSPGAAAPPAGSLQRWQGHALRFTLWVGAGLTAIARVLLPALGVLALLRTIFLLAFARRHSRKPERSRMSPTFVPSVTIVVPAFNEAAGIAQAVHSLATGDYPDLRVIVIDDGSTDDTAAIASSVGLPNVTVVSQANQGKAGALNTGIALAGTDIIVTVDGDTVFEPDTVRWLVQPFIDPTVAAVSGNTKVANRRGILGRWQHIEYVMGFNLDRRMYELARCMPTVPGAIGAFRASVLLEVGGVSDDTLAEDTDLTMAIGRAGWHVVYEERARAWTEAPATLSQLWKQRYRWSYGTMQAMWKHRGSMRRSEHSPLGRRALPYMFVFQVLLPLLAPLIDVFALYGILFLNRTAVLGFWLGFTLLQLLVGLYAFRLDGERLGPLWTMPLQQVVYRQLMYLVVIHSVVTALTGAPLRWHKLHRSGDFSAAPAASPPPG